MRSDPLNLGYLVLSPFFELSALGLGLLVGSFANVCIHRLPRGLSIASPPSRCPGCGALIRPWDNIPIVSYLVLRGRCRSCGQGISARYPLVEGANGLLYAGLAAWFGPTPRTLPTMVFVTALLVLTLIDLDHQLLPNAITLPGIAFGVACTLLPGWPVTTLGAVLSALGGYVALLAVAKAYHWTRGVEGLGQGDWKMVAMLGAFLGWRGMLLTVLWASLAGSLIGALLIGLKGRSGRHPLPLGTFLGAAGILEVFVGGPVLSWYEGFFRG